MASFHRQADPQAKGTTQRVANPEPDRQACVAPSLPKQPVIPDHAMALIPIAAVAFDMSPVHEVTMLGLLAAFAGVVVAMVGAAVRARRAKRD